jgi:hypothetical protein
MGMAILPLQEPEPFDPNHACKFTGTCCIAPTGRNKHHIAPVVATCRCGKVQPLYPDKLSQAEKSWIERYNHRIETNIKNGL